MARIKKGMSIDQVREIWSERSEAKTKTILDGFRRQHRGSLGHEGLGVYGRFQQRAAREKVRLAVRLLEQAGHEVTVSAIRKVTGQSTDTISNYWSPPRQIEQREDEGPPPPTYRFRGT